MTDSAHRRRTTDHRRAATAISGTLGGDTQSRAEQITLGDLHRGAVPGAARGGPDLWRGGWLGWHDVVIAFVMYAITGHGVTVGFHRYFTHKAFKPNRARQDRAGDRRLDGDPGSGRALGGRPPQAPQVLRPRGRPALPLALRRRRVPALIKGLFYAHMGWLFDTEQTSQRQYAPDLLKDRDIVRISRSFPWLVDRLDGAARARRRPLVDVLAGRRDRRSSGARWSGSRCCTTSPARSTRSVTPSASGPSGRATSPATSGGWRSPRWASRGTTCTTATRPARGTACCAASSTRRPASSG